MISWYRMVQYAVPVDIHHSFHTTLPYCIRSLQNIALVQLQHNNNCPLQACGVPSSWAGGRYANLILCVHTRGRDQTSPSSCLCCTHTESLSNKWPTSCELEALTAQHFLQPLQDAVRQHLLLGLAGRSDISGVERESSLPSWLHVWTLHSHSHSHFTNNVSIHIQHYTLRKEVNSEQYRTRHVKKDCILIGSNCLFNS